jgi:UDP-N-acetylmuramoylalanine-D-glutamate ligase
MSSAPLADRGRSVQVSHDHIDRHDDYRTYNADPESLRAAAAELIALRPDVMNAMAHPGFRPWWMAQAARRVVDRGADNI